MGNEEAGKFVRYNDPESIASTIDFIIRNPHTFEEMSANSFKRYKKYFTKSKHLEMMKEIILQ